MTDFAGVETLFDGHSTEGSSRTKGRVQGALAKPQSPRPAPKNSVRVHKPHVSERMFGSGEYEGESSVAMQSHMHRGSPSTASVSEGGEDRSTARVIARDVPADPQDFSDVQGVNESHKVLGIGDSEGVQCAAESQHGRGLLAAQIREQWRQRQDLHREEKALTLRMKAICRRTKGGDKVAAGALYDAMLDLYKPPKRRAPNEDPDAQIALMCCKPFFGAREIIESERAEKEKILTGLSKQLHVAEWWCGIRGANLLGLAALVGECGDIGAFRAKRTGKKSIRAIWRWCALGCFEDGTRQRYVEGMDAKECGENKPRRAVIWTVALSIFMAQSKPEPGPYRALYDRRKAYELERAPDMKPGHAHKRAFRIVMKQMLKDLWLKWLDLKEVQ